MDWFRFALGSLAVWRLTHLFVVEEGPWGVLSRLRGIAATRSQHGLLDCFYCFSVWAAIPASVLLGRSKSDRLLLWPALSGAAIFLENLAGRIGNISPAAYFEEGDKGDELLRTDHDHPDSAN